MPRRSQILATGEIYHILNRGVEKRLIFQDAREYHRFLEILRFYQRNHRHKFSRLSYKERQEVIVNKIGILLVEIICYCLMPNHFHLLLKQVANKGIAMFLQRITNSYSHYFNTRHDRIGPLFQGKFKSVRIEDDAQLLHTNRYIHINPTKAHIVEKPEDYLWSSYKEYLDPVKANTFCSKDIVLDQFSSIEKYQEFIQDQADYIKSLEKIEHLILEKEA